MHNKENFQGKVLVLSVSCGIIMKANVSVTFDTKTNEESPETEKKSIITPPFTPETMIRRKIENFQH
jgi:hypothetical protein